MTPSSFEERFDELWNIGGSSERECAKQLIKDNFIHKSELDNQRRDIEGELRNVKKARHDKYPDKMDFNEWGSGYLRAYKDFINLLRSKT